MSNKVSVIIPARNEIYLQKTIDEVLQKSTGEIEVIVILDGYWPDPPLLDNPRQIVVHRDSKGMRASINAGVDIATGKYIMKLDAHCMLSEGYDEILKADCDKDWIVIPRRFSLETETEEWGIRWHRPFTDYEYLTWPWEKSVVKFGLVGRVWDSRTADRINIPIDENLSFQGSCWFTHKEFFKRRIGFMSDDGYGTFVAEAQELGFKAWLGGGKVMTNKKCWYAHLWKGAPYREQYKKLYGVQYTRISNTEWKKGNRYNVFYWMQDKWEPRIHDFEWLIDKFSPVPTWPKDKSTWMPENS
jgi:glycosyltransferase involved in cell wall biosynthesis